MNLKFDKETAYIEPKALLPNHPSSLAFPLYRKSLYILSGVFRYNYTHEIYNNANIIKNSYNENHIQHFPNPNTKSRISLIFRNKV